MPENPPDSATPPKPWPVSPRDLALGALLLLLLLVFYYPAIHGEMVFDDDRLITMPELRSLHGLWSIWFLPPPQFSYYPLMHTAMWVEYRLWGDGTFWYHLANLCQHALAAFLVVALMRKLALPGAWLAAYVFALHPVNVETVAWISEQKNTLSTLFSLLAVLAWLRFGVARRAGWYAAATALFLCAVLCKTTAGTLPGTLLVIAWWRNGRIAWKRDVLALLPWFAAALALSLYSGHIEKESFDALGSDFSLSPAQHLLLAGRVPWFYLWKLVWPAGLMFNYPRWNVDAAVWWQWLFPAGLAALGAILFLRARKERAPLAVFLLFMGNLVPVMGLFYINWFRFSFVADHFFYLPGLALIIPLASWLAISAGKHARWVIPSATAALTCVLGPLTRAQSAMYHDMDLFYQQTIASNPQSGMAHLDYGLVLIKESGRIDDALSQMQEALDLRPNDVKLKGFVAKIFLDMGHVQQAVDALSASVAIKPDDSYTHFLLGSALARSPERIDEAISHLETSAQLNPNEPMTHYVLGAALLQSKPDRLQDAVTQLRAALRLNPGMLEAQYMLGNAFMAMPGHEAEAALQFQQVLEIKPDLAEAHYGLGCALSKLPGRKEEAIVNLEEALRINPDLVPARQKLKELHNQQ